MDKKKGFKKRHVLLILIVILFGPKLYRYINYELTKDNLVMEELEKIEYDDLAELEAYLLEIDFRVSVDRLNNIVYTIKEDNLEDWYYDFVYNYQYSDYGILSLWFAYDLSINDQYCYTKVVDDEYCYVSETETKNNTVLFDADSSAPYLDYGVAIIESSIYGETLYSSASSNELLEVIDDAYIIIQGPTTNGYDESVERLYSLSRERGSELDKELFTSWFTANVQKNKDNLKEMKDLSIEELIGNYSEYRHVIDNLSNQIGYIGIDHFKKRI